MIRHILVATPKNRARYAELFQQITVPKIRVESPAALHALYARWGLQR
ncbi:hypothetical protein SAMN05880590_110157 [Rhizobium sp. RU35A]|nr:hypothetical protein [Rhizobium sp. RU35A]SIR02011.1 hypothetical protein SAMN05880590_110157 [Rhizobium sp. RU35A]